MKKNITTKKEQGKKSSKVLEGALIGAVLGVATGMLLAPKSGKKMRADISKLASNFYTYGAVQVKKLRSKAEKI